MRYGVQMSHSVFWLTLLASLLATAFGSWGIWDAQTFLIFSEVAIAAAFCALVLGVMGLHACWAENPFQHRDSEN